MKHTLTLALTLGAFAASAAPVYPYGVCAHVTRSERDDYRLNTTILSMKLAGMKYVRSDFDYWAVKGKDGKLDFSNYDALMDVLERNGVTLLPIIYGVENPPKDFTKQYEYVKAIVTHYGKRFPVVEIWNEANIGFFKGSDPKVYAETLKASYEAVKSVNPSIKVAYTGTAGVPHGWIRETFKHGAHKYFDIMNVHPYSHPAQPEGSMDVNTEKLRALMAEFGVGDKPIWFTEIGWPTHTVTAAYPHILLAGLKVARPEQKKWNMILADNALAGTPDQTLAKNVMALLPAGSSVVACSQKETVARLAAGGVDAVIYPFDESFPVDTVNAINAFIKKGGVFVDFGGMPCYFGHRGAARVTGDAASIDRFPFGFRAWWYKDGAYPEEIASHATSVGLAAGVKQEPTGFNAKRFLWPDRIGKDSEWIPLISAKTNGVELASAVVIRYHGERTGAAVLCSLFTRGASGTNTEENQARYTARGLGIAMAEGVQSYFTYNLRSNGSDPYYSECHFGLMQEGFIPKPAFAAYAAFVQERPAGSVQKGGAWHNAARSFYYPQWTRPDGKKVVMLWKTGEDEAFLEIAFNGHPTFHNMYGRKIAVQRLASGAYLVPVSKSPLYVIGAALKDENASFCK